MSSASTVRQRNVEIGAGGVVLPGNLSVPPEAQGIVLFAHGSGSGRFSPRNNAVARDLQAGRLATLLLDLLTAREAENRRLVFDIDLLAGRLQSATDWVRQAPETASLALGYFGASTGAGAALQAAAQRGADVRAVVSRGGRPDLAMPYLSRVRAPTLLIVGGRDEPVIGLNQEALARLATEKRLVIVPAATHLFEEPGTLEQVAQLARDWFLRYLPESGDSRTE